MKLIKNIILLLVLGIAGIAAAQEDGRGGDGGNGSNGGNNPVNSLKFRYYSFDTVNSDFSLSGNPTLKLKTTVDVSSFLYITGNLSANWHVKGWGTGSDSQVNTIRFYHNGTLTVQFSQFSNLVKESGTKSGSQTIGVQGRLLMMNNTTKHTLFDSSLIPISNLNLLAGSNAPKFDVSQTGGVLRLDFTKMISVTADVGPGTYQNVGYITVSRN